jgi:hypothetical protein
MHGAATALQHALIDGVTLSEILDAMIRATAPAPPEAPLASPWAPLLPLSLSAFAETGAALGVAFPKLAVSVWLCGSDTRARAVAAERRITRAEVWQLPRLRLEAQRAGLDAETATVGQLVQALDGRVRDWRPAA